jgi:cytolysin-activating lysine-acyltransferase
VSPLSEGAVLRIVSGVGFLAGYSRVHLASDVLERGVVASLNVGQFRYYTDPRGVPLAFCNWALLSANVLEQVLKTHRELTAAEFRSGDLPYFCELLAPFGHCAAVVRDLGTLAVFKGRRVPGLRGKRDASGRLTARAGYLSF